MLSLQRFNMPVRHVISEDQDPTAVRLEALLRDRTPTELRKHLRHLDTLAVDSPQTAHIHLATAHKAKGLEHSQATLLSDFTSIRTRQTTKEWLQDTRKWDDENKLMYNQEIHLLYVAATRGKDHLYVDNGDLYFELTNLIMAEPEPKPERYSDDS